MTHPAANEVKQSEEGQTDCSLKLQQRAKAQSRFISTALSSQLSSSYCLFMCGGQCWRTVMVLDLPETLLATTVLPALTPFTQSTVCVSTQLVIFLGFKRYAPFQDIVITEGSVKTNVRLVPNTKSTQQYCKNRTNSNKNSSVTSAEAWHIWIVSLFSLRILATWLYQNNAESLPFD